MKNIEGFVIIAVTLYEQLLHHPNSFWKLECISLLSRGLFGHQYTLTFAGIPIYGRNIKAGEMIINLGKLANSKLCS